MTLTLYAYTSRSRAERVFWVLQELELQHTIIRLDYNKINYQQSEEFQTLSSVNPSLKVPVLVHIINGERFVLTESLAICMYLCRLTCKLIPTDATDEGRLNERIFFCVSEIESNLWMLDQALHIKRYSLDSETVDKLVQVIQRNIKVAEDWIDDFSYGKSFTLLDILCYHLFTWASMYQIVFKNKTVEYLKRLEGREYFPTLMKAAGSPATAK
jgi:glutathione S-transferase